MVKRSIKMSMGNDAEPNVARNHKIIHAQRTCINKINAQIASLRLFIYDSFYILSLFYQSAQISRTRAGCVVLQLCPLVCTSWFSWAIWRFGSFPTLRRSVQSRDALSLKLNCVLGSRRRSCYLACVWLLCSYLPKLTTQQGKHTSVFKQGTETH